jgi:amino acid transporter
MSNKWNCTLNMMNVTIIIIIILLIIIIVIIIIDLDLATFTLLPDKEPDLVKVRLLEPDSQVNLVTVSVA